jgi:hypothetical protein
LQGSRREEYQELRQRLGITKEQVAPSDRAFDCWLREQLLELHGLDLAQLVVGRPHELIFVWQPAS